MSEKLSIDDIVQKSKLEYWKVSITPTSGHVMSNFMDMPRVFLCEKSEAVGLFKKFYGILSTIHSFNVEKASEQEFSAQKKVDESRKCVIRKKSG